MRALWPLTSPPLKPRPPASLNFTLPRPAESCELPRTVARCHRTRLHVSGASLQRSADRLRLANEAKHRGEARGVVLCPLCPPVYEGVGAPSWAPLEPDLPAGA